MGGKISSRTIFSGGSGERSRDLCHILSLLDLLLIGGKISLIITIFSLSLPVADKISLEIRPTEGVWCYVYVP